MKIKKQYYRFEFKSCNSMFSCPGDYEIWNYDGKLWRCKVVHTNGKTHYRPLSEHAQPDNPYLGPSAGDWKGVKMRQLTKEELFLELL